MSYTPNYTRRENPKIKTDVYAMDLDTEQDQDNERDSSSAFSSTASTPITPTTQASITTEHHMNTNNDNNNNNNIHNRKPPPPIPAIPPPWHLRGDIYFFPFWTTAAQARAVPAHLSYSPLEAQSGFADDNASKPAGGLGMIQILRYTESPVGPYDELLVVPGSFDWEREEEEEPGGRKKRKTKGRNPKISRIYVSQKDSCYNGRLNWNTPKHLARFEWNHGPDGATTVKVYPHDTSSSSSSSSEAQPSTAPFFRATFKPLRLAPRFPFSTDWANYLGFDTTLVMPPLPAGVGSQGELPGTPRWCSLVPHQYSRSTALGWFDMAQGGQEREGGGGGGGGGYENFWPGLGRWQMGVKMEDAELSFCHPIETWEGC